MRHSAEHIVGIPLYTAREVSRLTHLSSAQVRGWAARMSAPRAPLYPRFSFADLVELRFVHAFARAGVRWLSLCSASAHAGELLGTRHPFSSRRFRTDGRTVLAQVATSPGASALLDLTGDQLSFERVIEPYLYDGLEFGPSDEAIRWWHEAGQRRVVIDPARSFGQPIVALEGVPTEMLFAAYHAEGSIEAAARVFEVSLRSAEAAVQFEQALAA